MSVAMRGLTFTQIKRHLAAHPISRAEVPTEHYVSLPLPTRRWSEPGYAWFASPASARQPGEPARLDPPDRWGVLRARDGGLVAYALWRAVPFADAVAWEPVELPVPDRTVLELREELAIVGDLLDAVAPSFLAGETARPTTRIALAEALESHLPRILVPWYHALTPDFFQWLAGETDGR